ncbi:TolB family protein [Marinifilum flexuosum]|uniref:WD40 repeat protein n=1 Tax=Marinifilum flexuosum TaxID=1117708 RepID=A0A419XAB4_9BACT|nr:hypothetical protein [Marinifilum flexuosum]RKE04655.1 hypothetical protein BXY64_1682 [Marinifilum flexuosum]
MIRRLAFLVYFVLVFASGYSQYFITGQDPASIKWKQINTKEFQIIFPQESENKARYVAALFEDLLHKGGKSLNRVPKKFSVVLHTHSANSNGLVAWAPKRMELYTTSAQNNDAQIWLDHLATHEFRHVVQMDKIEQGFTRVLNYVFGQQATAVVVGLYLPPWFMEGDAVCLETSMSESGRGRLPEFEQELRAQLLEKGEFSYDKAVNGSYNDYVTDRYKLGYHLVGKARSNYGDKIWDNTLTNVARHPLGIVSFSNGIKKSLSESRKQIKIELQKKYGKAEDVDWEKVQGAKKYSDGKLLLYFDTMQELLWEWKKQDAETDKSAYQLVSDREKYFTSKRIPHVTEQGDLIYLKHGLSDALCFEKLDVKEKTTKVLVPGYLSNIDYDYRNGFLVWAESKQNIRWEHADRSILVTYDIKSNERKTHNYKKSLFAPSFKLDASEIVAVASDQKGDNSLVIIDHKTGLIKQRIAAGKNEYFQTPQFMDDENIVLIVLNDKGKQIVKLNLKSEEREELLSSGYANMSRPVPYGDYLYFNASFTGIDNIFALDLNTKKVYQVTSSRFGARDAHVNADKNMYYSDYTSDGYLLAKAVIDTEEWKEWKGDYNQYPLAEQLSNQLGEKLNADTTNLDRFEVRNYSKLANLFSFHSWAPMFVDGIDGKADVGVSVASQNKLSTLLTTVGYKKEEGFDNGQFYANFSYRGWFPVIDSKITVGEQRYQFWTRQDRIEPEQKDTILLKRSLTLWNWENSISFPFNLSSGQYNRKLIPKVTYLMTRFDNIKSTALATTNPLGLGEYNLLQGDITRQVMEYQLFGYNIAKTAPRDVQYQWAQIFELNYRDTPWGDRDLGNTWSAEGHLYFPGLRRHHGIKFYGGYQYRSLNDILYSNMIKSPRGMSDLYGKQIATIGADYAMPLFYPDWNLGPLAYFKRIKMNAFVDYGYEKRYLENEEGDIFPFKSDYFSGGIELRSDLHVLRFSAPLDLGVRLGYENQTNSLFANFLISFNLAAY